MSKPSRAAFAFVFVTVALDLLALGIMIPVLPQLIVRFEGGDIAKASSVSGVFGFVWAAMQFVFSPVLGAVSDRYGRRPIILLSNLGLGLDYVLMAVAPSLSWLFVGRVISGITAASFATANAYVADVTPPEERAGKFGMLGAAFGLGFVVGPAVGGLLGQVSLRLPFWVAAGLSLANAAYGFFILPESLPPERRAKLGLHMANPLGSIALLGSTRTMLGLAASLFVVFLAHESLPSIFVLYADYRYAWDEKSVGIALAGIGLCSAIVSAALVGASVKRIGERATMIVGRTFGVIGFAMYGLAATSALFYGGIPFIALWGLAGPPTQSMMTREIAADAQGKLQGALSSLRGITGMIGPILFTQIFSAAIAGGAAPGAPYLVAAGLVFASIPLVLVATRAQPSAEAAGA